jgi:alkylhydroperoxidase/carboxymuconolactone decarboxylase family protein YurZ
VYAGVPKALDALRLMQEVFEEMDAAAHRKRRKK